MGHALALWTTDTSRDVTLPVHHNALHIINIMGEAIAPTITGKKMTLTLRPAKPVFLTGPKL
jgi:hypothetical protein